MEKSRADQVVGPFGSAHRRRMHGCDLTRWRNGGPVVFRLGNDVLEWTERRVSCDQFSWLPVNMIMVTAVIWNSGDTEKTTNEENTMRVVP